MNSNFKRKVIGLAVIAALGATANANADIIMNLDSYVGLEISNNIYQDSGLDQINISGLNEQLGLNNVNTISSTQATGSDVINYVTLANTNNDLISQIVDTHLDMHVDNFALFSSGRDVKVNGVSQIGQNTLNQAEFAIDGIPSVALVQIGQNGDYGTGPNYSSGGYSTHQSVENILGAYSDNRQAFINGSKVVDNVTVRSSQLGINRMNTAVVDIANVSDEGSNLAVAQTVMQYDYYNPTSGGYYDVSFIESNVTNVAIAHSYNDRTAIDPSVKNLDQTAAFVGNSLTINLGDKTLGLSAVDYAAYHNVSYFSGGVGAQAFFDQGSFNNSPIVNLQNVVISSAGSASYDNGDYDGYDFGVGHVEIANVSQSVEIAINNLSVNGSGTIELHSNFDQNFDGAIGTFEHTNGNQIFNQNSYGAAALYFADGLINDELANNHGKYAGPGNGNIALAVTGLGDAHISNLDQSQKVFLNSASIEGNLTSQDGLGYSLNQYASSNYNMVDLRNTAVAYVNDSGMASFTGNNTQELVAVINSASVTGTLSAELNQNVNYAGDISASNELVAVSAGKQVIVSGVDQSIYTSLNSATIGTLSATITQTVGDGVSISSNNEVLLAGTSAKVSNITQSAVNNINTISAVSTVR